MTIPSATAHRPYPPPPGPWLMAQSWRNLLFAHWPIPVQELRRVLPCVLPLDTYDGQAWIGIVPFQIKRARLRWLPPLPGVSSFPELHVRTYVTIDGKPGVYLFSLDAASALAVRLARLANLPVFHAKMRAVDAGGWIEYHSIRSHRGSQDARLMMRYRPIGTVLRAAATSLTAWLTERYCVYVVNPKGQVYRAEIHHPPWQLQPAEAECWLNSMAAPLDIGVPAAPPLLHFVRRQDVVAWWPESAAPQATSNELSRQRNRAVSQSQIGRGVLG